MSGDETRPVTVGFSPAPRWVFGPSPDPSRVEALEAGLGLPRALCALLLARGHGEPEEAKTFLRPLLSSLHSPHHLNDLGRAVERIRSALRGQETIFVHGDYDVDGMAATALLTRWLRNMGGRVVPFVPHRMRDGYDFGGGGLDEAFSSGASLLVTVDCGILAHKTIAEAGVRGLDVIVTDHHSPGDDLPSALAVVNPSREDDAYPNPHLCGAGVAYKLCQGLAEAEGVGEEELHPLLDLVGLATIADLVPLKGENRVMARYGLKALAQTRNLGLRALMDEAGVDVYNVSAGDVGFRLSPRLNALGRMGEPRDGLRLLLTDDRDEARRLASRAGDVNRVRQQADQQTLKEAMDLLGRDFDPTVDFGVVLGVEGWHPGVVGIVASRIVERLHRPVVLFALDGEVGKGSARSIPEYHLLEGVRAGSAFLERFGGHRQAAGMEIRKDRIPAFRKAFNQHAREALQDKELRPTLRVEVDASLAEMSRDLLRYMRHLGPHGMGNPAPTFLVRGVTVGSSPRTVGAGHLKVRLHQGGAELDAIGFHLAHRIPPEALGAGLYDVVFQLRENEYRGVRRLQAHLKDLRVSGASPEFNGSGP